MTCNLKIAEAKERKEQQDKGPQKRCEEKITQNQKDCKDQTFTETVQIT